MYWTSDWNCWEYLYFIIAINKYFVKYKTQASCLRKKLEGFISGYGAQAMGLTHLRQQDPWELTWECTWQRRTRRDWELAKATKPVKMAGIPQGTGRNQKKVQNCLLLTLNLTTCLFLVCFSNKNYTAFTFVLLFLMRRTFASQRRTTWIVILVFSGTFFEVSWIISQCFVPVTWL